MLRVLVLSHDENSCRIATEWLSKNNKVGNNFLINYSVAGTEYQLKLIPYWPGCCNKMPSSIVTVLVFFESESDLANLDSIMNYYINLTIKILVYKSVSSSNYESKWKMTSIIKSSQEQIWESIIKANNDFFECVKAILSKIDKENSDSIQFSKLKDVCTELGQEMQPEQFELISVCFEQSGFDDRIPIKDFVDWWKSGRKAWASLLIPLFIDANIKKLSSSAKEKANALFKKIAEIYENEFDEEEKAFNTSLKLNIDQIKQSGMDINLGLGTFGPIQKAEFEPYRIALSLDAFSPYLLMKFKANKNKSFFENLVNQLKEMAFSSVPCAFGFWEDNLEVKTSGDESFLYLSVKPVGKFKDIFDTFYGVITESNVLMEILSSLNLSLRSGVDFNTINEAESLINQIAFGGIEFLLKGKFRSSTSKIYNSILDLVKELPKKAKFIAQLLVPLTIIAGANLEIGVSSDEEAKTMFKELMVEEMYLQSLNSLKLKNNPEFEKLEQEMPIVKKVFEFLRKSSEEAELIVFTPHLSFKLGLNLKGLPKFFS